MHRRYALLCVGLLLSLGCYAQATPGCAATLLLRPSEVLSGIANPPILKVAKNALRSLLQHSHMRGGRFA
jgi:hypothetical protein